MKDKPIQYAMLVFMLVIGFAIGFLYGDYVGYNRISYLREHNGTEMYKYGYAQGYSDCKRVLGYKDE